MLTFDSIADTEFHDCNEKVRFKGKAGGSYSL